MAVGPEDRRVLLRNCLVEGDSVQEAQVRRRKQRALLVSVIVQILFVAALVLFPLFSKGENIANRVVVFPPVPFSPARPHNPTKPGTQPSRVKARVCSICYSGKIPPTVVTHDHSQPVNDDNPPEGMDIPGTSQGGTAIPGTLPGIDTHHDTPPPPPLTKERLLVSESVIAARLVRRIAPTYPPLAVQIRREGRVELHAIISTAGSIQSLEVVSGDPFFIPSALAAVRQWRYQPTLLNGQPVEVDTHITVIYTLRHSEFAGMPGAPPS